ncbi:MAG: Maf family protein [Chitinophagaceae bacterium]|jgi:septum formation protein|nr:Maf family protein [Chitinophagaceae bacterium]
MAKVVLASSSQRRKLLLEWAEFEFDVLFRETDESYPEGLDLDEIAVHVARGKALATMQSDLYNRYDPNVPVIGADTTVILHGQVIGKPVNREEAIRTLTALSGQKHQVITGVVIMNRQKEISFTDKTDVVFHTLARADIEFYVDKYKPYDKAGAYAIQEWIGVVGIKEIHGDFYNVMGLPVSKLIHQLAAHF